MSLQYATIEEQIGIYDVTKGLIEFDQEITIHVGATLLFKDGIKS